MNFRHLARLLLSLFTLHSSLFFSLSAAPTPGQTPGKTILVTPDASGALTYTPYTDQGDTIPDFSHCGYKGGGIAIPEAPVRCTLSPVNIKIKKPGDDTARIQEAIDTVSALPLQPDGMRGAVLLQRGTYRCAEVLRIQVSGVVLRGEGDDENGTIISATGAKQRPIISIGGGSAQTKAEPLDDWKDDDSARGGKNGPIQPLGKTHEVTDTYVPVGAKTVTLDDITDLAIGQTVYLIRRGNAAWIHEIAMDRITPRDVKNPEGTKQWQPFDLKFDRIITAINGNRITLDAPLVCAIDKRWGGGALVRYTDSGRIENCGVENIRGISNYNNTKTLKLKDGATYPSDENHATYIVSFDAVKNAWARNLTSLYFYHGPAILNGAAKWITVQDCRALEPVSEITGGRRYPYNINGAQLCLIQRCYADKARHAFVVGARVPGPNVFLNCRSTNNYATSEPHHRWSTGGLYDNVEADMAIQDRQWMGSGHGWAGANYVAWNCRGKLICQQPPTAQNFAIGFVGKRDEGAFKDRPAGWWESYGKPVQPESLYLAQLAARKIPNSK